MHFFGFRDLTSSAATEVSPWAWAPPGAARTAVLGASKAGRLKALANHGWLVYSPVRATSATSYVEKSNPPAGVRGLVLDYDVPLVEEHLATVLSKLDDQLVPQWVEKTLSGHFRLVWVFGRDVPCPDGDFVEAVWRALADRIRPFDLHPGLDKHSFAPGQRWTAGLDWFSVGGPAELPAAVLTECLWEAGKSYRTDAKGDVPIEEVAKQFESRWPGKWVGPFEVGARGVRIWDPKADNPTGCMVRPEGMLCFTGPKAFVSWSELFGSDWVRQVAEDKLENATANIYFDGRSYWHLVGADYWRPRSREDTMLELQDRGFDARVTKGKSISDCGRLLNLIQKTNRIDAAVSLVNHPPGVVDIRNQRILNTSRIKALEPHAEPCTPDTFPWLWDFLCGHFARPESDPLPHFLGWLQRAYRALHEHRSDMGQALFLCGPRHNGKTLLAVRIIAPMLGNVYADPFDYLTGRTTFNSELFESFLWCLNDADSPRENEKGSVLSKIKDAVVNPSHSYHRKFGDRTQVDWTGRIVVTLNDDPSSTGQLPEVNSNTADKMCFFASQPYRKKWPSNKQVEETLRLELPKFCRWLLDWEPPEKVLENSRVGVKSYFDEYVLETSRRQNYAFNFRELLTNWIRASWGDGEMEKTLSPTEVMSHLTMCDPVAQLAREWKVPYAAKALQTLARDPNSGVVYVDGPVRLYTLHRSIAA